MAATLKDALLAQLDTLAGTDADALLAQRYARLRRYGAFRAA
jgi:acetyl-CoA carboxylase alpha subunit